MCLYFNILYGWLSNNKHKGACKTEKARQKKSNRAIAAAAAADEEQEQDRSQQQRQARLSNFKDGANEGKQYERNLIESLKEAESQEKKLSAVDCRPSEIATVDKLVIGLTNKMESDKNNSGTGVSNEQQASSKLTSRSDIDDRHTSANNTSGNKQQQSDQAFKIKTYNRRHVDFDEQFDLNDVKAPNRSHWSGPFHFIQAADSQFGMIDSYIHHKTEPGWSEEIKLCENLVTTCNQMEPKPKFMIVCGDLVDSWPNTETRRKQVIDFKRIFSKLDEKIPLVCVCGNHDVGDEPTINSVQEYRQNFGDDYFYFTLNDVLFIVINSQFYQHRDFVKDYASQQDEWLESMLAKCKLFKYSIVFEHIPWFLKHFDEEDDYFNIKKEVRLDWLRKFKDAGVTKIMCGHYHRNAGGWFENMELVVTSAIGAQCGNDKSGVRIVKVLEESIEHQYYAMQDIPKQIQLS